MLQFSVLFVVGVVVFAGRFVRLLVIIMYSLMAFFEGCRAKF